MTVSSSLEGWKDYVNWQSIDKKIVAKLNALIREIARTPYEGNGNPEALIRWWTGWRSRRISNEQRRFIALLGKR